MADDDAVDVGDGTTRCGQWRWGGAWLAYILCGGRSRSERLVVGTKDIDLQEGGSPRDQSRTG